MLDSGNLLFSKNVMTVLYGKGVGNRPVHGQDYIMGNQDKQYRYGSNP